MKIARGIKGWATIILISFLTVGCFVFRSNSTKTEIATEEVKSPVKAHLNDGSTVLFGMGAKFTDEKIIGSGTLYSISLEKQKVISELDRNDVAAYEVYESKIDPAPTFFVSTLATGAGIFGISALSVAIFGSCPTIYSQIDTTNVLETELFSNSIAPLLETRDVAWLAGKPNKKGLMELIVRNEALETHYINQLGLLEVKHDSNATIVPTLEGSVLSVDKLTDPELIQDLAGNSLHSTFKHIDSKVYQSDITFQSDTEEVQWDQIEMVFPPTGADSTALYLKLRNSLFSTVLLYDYLLASQGTASLDWIGSELKTVSGAVALGDFDHSYMGLRIEHEIDGIFQQVARVPNTGPIAWREIAIPLLTSPNDSVRLRLNFLADSWRIDQIKLAQKVDLPEITYLPVSHIEDVQGTSHSEKINRLNAIDDQYIVTYPGDQFTISFETQSNSKEQAVTYLIEGTGYYIEWIRSNWLDQNKANPITYSSDIVIAAQKRWQNTKGEFEDKFFKTRIPVR